MLGIVQDFVVTMERVIARSVSLHTSRKKSVFLLLDHPCPSRKIHTRPMVFQSIRKIRSIPFQSIIQHLKIIRYVKDDKNNSFDPSNENFHWSCLIRNAGQSKGSSCYAINGSCFLFLLEHVVFVDSVRLIRRVVRVDSVSVRRVPTDSFLFLGSNGSSEPNPSHFAKQRFNLCCRDATNAC